MIRTLTKKIIPVTVPIAGVLCIGSCIHQEFQYQTRYWPVSDSYAIKKETDDEEYKAIMYNFFFH